MRFRIKTVRRRKFVKRRRKRGKGLPYIKNNHVYFGKGAVGRILTGIAAKIADAFIPI